MLSLQAHMCSLACNSSHALNDCTAASISSVAAAFIRRCCASSQPLNAQWEAIHRLPVNREAGPELMHILRSIGVAPHNCSHEHLQDAHMSKAFSGSTALPGDSSGCPEVAGHTQCTSKVAVQGTGGPSSRHRMSQSMQMHAILDKDTK